MKKVAIYGASGGIGSATARLLKKMNYLKDFFSKKDHYSMNSFYISQRKQLNVLLENGALIKTTVKNSERILNFQK